jgi:hypothetical protein
MRLDFIQAKRAVVLPAEKSGGRIGTCCNSAKNCKMPRITRITQLSLHRVTSSDILRS